ncbi:MAG: DNRLRE domain-containing protein, partial [Anaerolineae bacterium]|nr:DNRLRE domain-containing protein [Anaerolineae bacterium]
MLGQGMQGYQGVADTFLRVNVPLSNYASQQTLSVGCEGTRSRSRALVRFDLGFLDPDQTHVIGARLLLLPVARIAGGAMDLQAYALQRPWRADEANWLEAARGVPWGVPGADAAADRAARPAAVARVERDYRWVALDVTDLVRRWVRDPAGNHGVLLTCTAAEEWAEYLFGSSERHAIGERPQLQVVYGVVATPTPTVTPTPTATWTATSTPSPTSTATPTGTPTATWTSLPPTATWTPTPLPTATWTPMPPTATWTPVPSPTPTLPPTKTPTPTAPPTPVPPPTKTPTP